MKEITFVLVYNSPKRGQCVIYRVYSSGGSGVFHLASLKYHEIK